MLRYLEILLKIAFVASAVFFIVSRSVYSPFFIIFLSLSLLMGFVLIFNDRAPSYPRFPTRRDFKIRDLEGVLLCIFSVFNGLLIIYV